MNELDKAKIVAQSVIGDAVKDFFKESPENREKFIEFTNKRIDDQCHPTIQATVKACIKATVDLWRKQ